MSTNCNSYSYSYTYETTCLAVHFIKEGLFLCQFVETEKLLAQCKSITCLLEMQARFLFFLNDSTTQIIYALNYLLHIGLMLPISKVLTFLSTLPMEEQVIPWHLSKQISRLFFQMSVQVYSIPGQSEGRSRVFLELKRIDLSYELSLTCAGNVNFYKIVHHPIPAREKREHPGNFQNKSVSSDFI